MEVKNEKYHRRNGGQYKESEIAHVTVNMSDSYYLPSTIGSVVCANSLFG